MTLVPPNPYIPQIYKWTSLKVKRKMLIIEVKMQKRRFGSVVTNTKAPQLSLGLLNQIKKTKRIQIKD